MSYFKNMMHCVAIILGMTSAFMLSGCAGERSSRVGEMSKFDMATASEEEIAEALEKDGKVVISGGFLFETDSAKLGPGTGDLVRRIADVMKRNPNLKISVVGHTDSTGDYNYNIKLSERRAKAFVAALVQDGVAANRLTGVGVGPQSPVSTNDTAEGRALNRRVELVVIH